MHEEEVGPRILKHRAAQLLQGIPAKVVHLWGFRAKRLASVVCAPPICKRAVPQGDRQRSWGPQPQTLESQRILDPAEYTNSNC